MEGIDRIKIIKNIPNRRKLRTNTEPHSLNSSSNQSLSFIQCGDGTIKRIRNKTSYKEIYLERLNYNPTEIPFSKGRNLSYSNVYNNKNLNINSPGDSFYSNPSKKNLKSQSFIDNIKPLNFIGKIKGKQKKKEIEKLVLNIEDDENFNNQKNYINKKKIKEISKEKQNKKNYNKISIIKNPVKEHKKRNNHQNIIDVHNFQSGNNINDEDDEEKNESINSKIIEKLEKLSSEINRNIENNQELEIKNNKINENKKYKFEPKKNKKKINNNLNEDSNEIHLSNNKNDNKNDNKNEDGSVTLQNSKIVVYSINNEKTIENENKYNKRYNDEDLYNLSGSDNFQKIKNNINISKENSPIKMKQSDKFSIVSNDSIFNSKNTEFFDINKQNNKKEENKDKSIENNNNFSGKESIILNNKENIQINNKENIKQNQNLINDNFETNNAESEIIENYDINIINEEDKNNDDNNSKNLNQLNTDSINSNNNNDEYKKSINQNTDNKDSPIPTYSSNNNENEGYDEERVRVFDEALKDNSKMNLFKNSIIKEEENENEESLQTLQMKKSFNIKDDKKIIDNLNLIDNDEKNKQTIEVEIDNDDRLIENNNLNKQESNNFDINDSKNFVHKNLENIDSKILENNNSENHNDNNEDFKIENNKNKIKKNEINNEMNENKNKNKNKDYIDNKNIDNKDKDYIENNKKNEKENLNNKDEGEEIFQKNKNKLRNVLNNFDNFFISEQQTGSFNTNIKNEQIDNAKNSSDRKRNKNQDKNNKLNVLTVKNLISENKNDTNNSNEKNKNEINNNKFNEKKLKFSPQIINYSSLNNKKIIPLKINKINFSIKESPKIKNNENNIKNNIEEPNNKNVSMLSSIHKIQNEISNSKINQSTISKNTVNCNNYTNSNTIAPLTPSERFLLNEDFINNGINVKKKNFNNNNNDIMEPNYIPKNPDNNNNYIPEINEIDDFIQFLKIKNQNENTNLSSLIQIKEQLKQNYKKNKDNILKKKKEFHKKINTQETDFLYESNNINYESPPINKIKYDSHLNNIKMNNIHSKVIKQKKNIINNTNSNLSFSIPKNINNKVNGIKNQKSYKSIFDIKDDNINNNDKCKFNFFGLDKYDELNHLTKNKSTVNIKQDIMKQDFYKEKDNSQIMFQGFNNEIKIPKDKYLNKVKEDVKKYENKKKQDMKFTKVNIPIQKNTLPRSNTSNSLRKNNINSENMIIMPANTLEDVIDARAKNFSKK